jgi:hypothetical protein
MRNLSLLGVAAVILTACGDGGPGPSTPPGIISLAIGETRGISASDASTIQVSGGSAGAEFVLIPFYSSQAASATVALDFSSEQITAAAGPPTPDIIPGPDAGPTLERAASLNAAAPARFDAELRRAEREVFGPRMPAARAAWAARAAARKAARNDPGAALNSVAAATPAVGDAVTLNAARSPNCTSPSNRAGHVVAVSQYAVVVADDANPALGFDPTEYTEIAQAFADSVHPLDTRNFGTPGDIDNNSGRAVIFFTRAVNELTPAGADYVIGGFFHPRDLFPKVGPDANSTTDDCPSSNEAEMFYMLVPDPAGTVNGNIRSKDSVKRATIGVLAHEYQHLINASRRIANNASDFEEVWLNEGLSHIAEELMFYQASGLTPKQNVTVTKLRSSQQILDAVNAYQVSNIGRLIEYLKDPEGRSPHAADDELATRGATWQFLRYAADRSTTAEQTIWTNLANSRTTGIANATAVFGGNFFNLERDWATAQYTDDAVSPTTATIQHPSWNYRSVVPALLPAGSPYPLKTRPLTSGTPVSLTLRGGSAAYLRFGVAGGATATIRPTSSGAAIPAAVSLTVVRTK